MSPKPLMMTAAPARARHSATPSPMPLVDPVTSASREVSARAAMVHWPESEKERRKEKEKKRKEETRNEKKRKEKKRKEKKKRKE